MEVKFATPNLGRPYVPRSRTTEASWEQHKDFIIEQRQNGVDLKTIQATMVKEHGFHASVQAYKYRLKLWGNRRYLSRVQRHYMISQIAARKGIPSFRVVASGDVIEESTVRRVWEARGKEGIYIPAGRAEETAKNGSSQVIPSTQDIVPSDLVAFTPSPSPAEDGEILEEDIIPSSSESVVSERSDISTPADIENDRLIKLALDIIRLFRMPQDEYDVADYEHTDEIAIAWQTVVSVGSPRVSEYSPLAGTDIEAFMRKSSESVRDLMGAFDITMSASPSNGNAEEDQNDGWILLTRHSSSRNGHAQPERESTRYHHEQFEQDLSRAKHDLQQALKLNEAHRPREAIPLFDSAISFFKRAGRCFFEITLSANCSKGWALLNCGDYERAFEILKPAAKGWEELLGPDHMETRMAYSLLGFNQVQLGKLAEAQECYNRSINEREHEDILSSGDKASLLLLTEIGRLDRLQGRISKATELQKRILSRFEELHGTTNDNRSIPTMHELGLSLLAQYKFEEASPLLNNVKTLHEKNFGKHNPTTLSAYADWAVCLLGLGKISEGQKCLNDVLEAQEATSDESNPEKLITVFRLGTINAAQKDTTPALEYYWRALVGRKKALGDRHPHTLTSIRALTSLLEERGLVIYAKPMAYYVLRGLEEIYDPLHPEVLGMIVQFASIVMKCNPETFLALAC